MTRNCWNAVLGMACLVLSILVLMVWIPADIESGLVETVRQQTTIGDALAPTAWAIGIGLFGTILALTQLPLARLKSPGPASGGPTLNNVLHIASLLLLVGLSLSLMLHAGPWAVKLAQSLGFDLESYRNLRDTRPWKYIGYILGGFCLVFGLMSYIEGRPTLRLALIALVAVVSMALLYDLPFKHLLLPPNGDQ